MARRRLGFWRRLAVVVVKPVVTVWTRRTWSGMDQIPADGGVIIVSNHLSHADPLVCAHFIYDAGRWPRYLGKASVFKVPVVGWILHRAQQIPVERGTIDAARSLDLLIAAIRAGGAVVIYPEGTTTREPELWPMRGKTGAARLALATGAPVVPVVMWGPQRMFDTRTKRFDVHPRIPVTVQAGPPVDLSRWAGAPATRTVLEEMTEEIMLRLRDMLAGIRGGTPPPLWSPARGSARTAGPEAAAEPSEGAAGSAEPSASAAGSAEPSEGAAPADDGRPAGGTGTAAADDAGRRDRAAPPGDGAG